MSRKVIIIGAGIAGLCCAKRLISSGFDVSIFEKSRGIGGRLASRRIDNGIFNHGAASLPDFRKNDDMPKFLKYLLEKGYEIFPVNPKESGNMILGQYCFDDLL